MTRLEDLTSSKHYVTHLSVFLHLCPQRLHGAPFPQEVQAAGGLAKYQQLRFAVVLVATRALLVLIQLHPRPGTFPLYVHYIHLHSVLLVGVKMENIQPSRDTPHSG